MKKSFVISILSSVLCFHNCAPSLNTDKICDLSDPAKFIREALVWRTTTNQEFYCSLRIRDRANISATGTGLATGTGTTTGTATGTGTGTLTPFSFAYEKNAYSFLINQNQAVPLPTVVGTLQNVSISPSLPAGLNLNVNTGAISGTATPTSPATNYSIIASSNAGQTVNVTMKIRVFGPQLQEFMDRTEVLQQIWQTLEQLQQMEQML